MTARQAPSRLSVRGLAVAAALVLFAAAPAAAQYLGGGTKSANETQIADLEQLRDKFIALAEAFPADLYDWRPMEGVRSVRDVICLIAAEGVLFPTMWGYEAPEWTASGGFGAELERLNPLPKQELIAELGRSYDHVIGIAMSLSDEDRAREVNFFGLNVGVGTAVTLMANDMHEHLGQSIAYARMNRIVPPWSRNEGQE